jgi:hypothetical protein
MEDGDLRELIVNLMKKYLHLSYAAYFLFHFFDVVLLLDLRLSSVFRLLSDRLVFSTLKYLVHTLVQSRPWRRHAQQDPFHSFIRND